jgi:hypothetical protein
LDIPDGALNADVTEDEEHSGSSDDSSYTSSNEDDGEEDLRPPSPFQVDEIPGFESSASPAKQRRVAITNPLREVFPLTTFTREEIMAVFTSLKVRHKVSDALLLEIFGSLNRMLDKFSVQRPLPTTRYAVTRSVL